MTHKSIFEKSQKNVFFFEKPVPLKKKNNDNYRRTSIKIDEEEKTIDDGNLKK